MRRMGCLVAVVAAGVLAFGVPAVPGVGVGTATAGPPEAVGPTQVPLAPNLRRCDFSQRTWQGPKGFARGLAMIDTVGSDVVAEVRLEAAQPNTLYNVRLLQAPRPSSLSCTVDTVAVGLQTDAFGNGVVTVRDVIRPGATGAWVGVAGPPKPGRELLGEHLSSDFIASI